MGTAEACNTIKVRRSTPRPVITITRTRFVTDRISDLQVSLTLPHKREFKRYITKTRAGFRQRAVDLGARKFVPKLILRYLTASTVGHTEKVMPAIHIAISEPTTMPRKRHDGAELPVR